MRDRYILPTTFTEGTSEPLILPRKTYTPETLRREVTGLHQGIPLIAIGCKLQEDTSPVEDIITTDTNVADGQLPQNVYGGVLYKTSGGDIIHLSLDDPRIHKDSFLATVQGTMRFIAAEGDKYARAQVVIQDGSVAHVLAAAFLTGALPEDSLAYFARQGTQRIIEDLLAAKRYTRREYRADPEKGWEAIKIFLGMQARNRTAHVSTVDSSKAHQLTHRPNRQRRSAPAYTPIVPSSPKYQNELE